MTMKDIVSYTSVVMKLSQYYFKAQISSIMDEMNDIREESKDDIEKAALDAPETQKWIEGKTIRKVIVVPKRIINIVVG